MSATAAQAMAEAVTDIKYKPILSDRGGWAELYISERKMSMTLENKLGITDSLELAKAEEKISKKKAIIFVRFNL